MSASGGVTGLKKLLFVVLGMLAIVIMAVLVVPSFIDWNDYKGEIATQVKELTGRDLSIDGDVRISVLPAPVLVAQGVRVANVEGASQPNLMRLKSLEIRIALGPLLGGTVQVETVKLVDPVIHLERLPDGRVSWQLGDASDPHPGTDTGTTETPASAPTDQVSQPSVRLDSFVIENGTVVYQDIPSGFSERVEQVNAEIAAASLTGPFESAGSLFLRGAQIDYAATVGQIIHGRTVPVNVRIESPLAGTRLNVSGALVDLAEEPRFRGKASAGGENLSRATSVVLGKGKALPGWLAQPYEIAGAVTAGAAAVRIEDVDAHLGNTRASGSFAMRLQPNSSFVAALDVKHINLDKWLGMAGDANGRPSTVGDAEKGAEGETAAPNRASEPPTLEVVLPETVSGSLEVSVDVVTFRGSNIREIRLIGELAGGEVTVSQMSALLPGGSDIFASGFVTIRQGRPQFEGDIEAEISDLRRVLAWLDIEPPHTSSERLRRAAFSGQLRITDERIEARRVDLTVDTSRLTGGIAIALRRRLAFGADFTIDRLNLDAYMPLSDRDKDGTEGSPAAGRQRDPASPAGDGTSSNLPIPPLAALTGFDANLKLRVNRLTFRRIPITDILLDATLFAGALEIRELSVGDLADASGQTSGTISSLSEIPELENLQFELRGGDLARLLRAFEIEPPGPAGELGTVVVTGRADGRILSPNLDVQIAAAEATVGYEGRLPILTPGTDLEARVSMQHPDVARLLRSLGIGYRPRGRIGALSVSSQVRNQDSTWGFSDLAAQVGEVTIAGSGRIDLSGDRPNLSAQLTTNEVVVDPFLPARRTASLLPPHRFDPGRAILVPAALRAIPFERKPSASFRTVQGRGGEAGRWSTDEIDLSVLNVVDAEIALRSEALAYEGYRLEEADLAFDLSDGLLRIERLNGDLFGGAMSGHGQLDSSTGNRLRATVEIEGAELARAGPALGSEGMTEGRLNAVFEGETAGTSTSEMINSLNGNGRFSLDQVKASGGGSGPMAALVEVIAGLNQIGGLLGGNVSGEGLADASGTFTIEDGVARSDDLRLVSNVGEATAGGTVDLPNWTIDVEGQLAVARNIATELLAERAGVDLSVPLGVSGPLDAPDVKLDTAKLPGGVLRLPGKILDGTGVEGILRQLIPGSPGGP